MVTPSAFSPCRALNRRSVRRYQCIALAILGVGIGSTPSARASNQTWVATPTDANWITTTNWSGQLIPGASNPAATSLSNDVATFNAALSGTIGGSTNPITLDPNRNVKSILFDTAAVGAFQIGSVGGNVLQLTDTGSTPGSITMSATVASPEVIAAPVLFRLATNTNGDPYSFINNATSPTSGLNVIGGLTDGATSLRSMGITLDGTNTGNNSLSAISAVGAVNLTKQGSGTWILKAADTFPQITSSGITASVTVTAGTLVCQSAGSLGAITAANLKVSGTGILRLDSIALANSGVTLDGGGEILGNGSSSVQAISVAVSANAPGLATTNSADVLTVTGPISGGTAGSTVMNISGPGEVLLSAPNTYTGGWSLNSGTTVLGTAASLGPATTAALGFGPLSTATLTLNGFNVGLSSLTGSTPNSGIVQNATASPSVLTVSNPIANSFGGVIQDGSPTGTLGLVKQAAGSLTLSGSNTYSGPTTINAGKVIVTGALGNTAITVSPASAGFGVYPGSATVNAGTTTAGSGGATLTLPPGITGAGAAFDMVDGAIGTFNLNQQLSFQGTALNLGGAGSALNAPSLTFDIGPTGADQLNVSTGSVSIGATGADIGIHVLSTAALLTPGSYVLINAPGGGLSPLTLLNSGQTIGAGSTAHTYAFSLAYSTNTQEVLTVAVTPPTYAYWTGAHSSSWAANTSGMTNWATDHVGATDTQAVPVSTSTVFFTADGATHLTSTLDAPFTVNALVLTGTGSAAATGSVGISAGTGGLLTLTAAAAFNDSNGAAYAGGVGLLVQSGSASHTISAPIVLGTSQTWEIDNSIVNALTVSGGITDAGSGYSLTKTGVGTLNLSGSNTYTGNTVITGGTLLAGAAGALDPLSSMKVMAGTLDTSGFANTVKSLGVGSGGSLNLGVGNLLTSTHGAFFSGTLNVSGTPTARTVELIAYTSETGTFSNSSAIPAGYSLAYKPTELDLVLTAPISLTWNNTAAAAPSDGISWDQTNNNWNSTNGILTFSNQIGAGDNVTFNDNNNGKYAVTIAAAVTPSATIINNSAGNYNFSGLAGICGAGGLTKLGTGSLTLATTNTYTGNTNVSGGTLIFSGPKAFPAGTNLFIDGGAKVQVSAHTGSSANVVVLQTNQMTLGGSSGSWTGLLDLTDNSLIVHTGLLTTINSQITAAYAGGTWAGPAGITSSTAAADTTYLTTIGVMLNDHAGAAIVNTFDGVPSVDGDLLVKYTYYGDANLDGAVDGSDYTLIDNGFLNHLTGWQNGDFNYDGVIDGSDYTLIDNAFNSQGATLGNNPAILIATTTALVANKTSAVPEPGAASLLGFSLVILASLRRRAQTIV